jgi:sarcosine oxidase subunit beta
LRTEGVAVAAHEPASGYADAAGTIAGFLEAACRLGGEVRAETTVIGFRTSGDAIAGVETTAGPIAAPIVILAAGAWSAPLLRDLHLALPITGALTQWIGFAHAPESAPPAMTVGDGVSLSYFRADGPNAERILLGLGGLARRPLADPAADEAPILADIITMAHERLAARLVGGELARPSGGRTGPITLTPDDLPIIDRHPDLRGLYFFAGDCGSSFKTAPAIGRALAEWATLGQPQIADLTAFRLGRFTASTG